MVNPTVLRSISDNSYIQSSSGKYYKKSTVNNRPNFMEVGSLPAGTKAETDFNSYGGPGGPITKLSEADLMASGSVGSQVGLEGDDTPRIYFTPQGPTNTPPKPDQKLGIVPMGVDPKDYNALQGISNNANPQNAGVPTRAVPGYTTPSSAPFRPNLVNEYGNISNRLNLSGAEGELQTAKQSLIDTENTILAEADKIKGEAVSSVVIGRKLVKLDADTAESLRQAKSAVQLAQDQVDNKNKTLSILMDLTKSDYNTARSDWEFEYNKAMQLYSALNTEENRQRDDARAQLAVLQKNGFDYNTATPEMKSMVDSLDLQAYGRTGVTAATPPGEKEIDIYTDTNGNRIRVTQNQSTKQYKQTVIGTGLNADTSTTNDVFANLQNQKIPTSVSTSGGKLTKSYVDKLTTAGLPPDVIDGIWKNVVAGNSFEEIRQYITSQGGDPKILDTFVQILQNRGNSSDRGA